MQAGAAACRLQNAEGPTTSPPRAVPGLSQTELQTKAVLLPTWRRAWSSANCSLRLEESHSRCRRRTVALSEMEDSSLRFRRGVGQGALQVRRGARDLPQEAAAPARPAD